MKRLGFTSGTGTVVRLVIAVFWAMALVFTLTNTVPDGQRLFLLGLLAAFALLTIAALWHQTPERVIYLILALQALIIFAGALIIPDFTVLIPAAAILAVVTLRPPRGLGATIPFILLLIGFDIYISGLVLGLRDGIVTGFITFCFAGFANILLRADEARKKTQRLLEELQTTHSQLQEYAEQVEELAVAEERNRLSREVHDTLGHRLTVSIVQLEGAERLIDQQPDRAAEKIKTVRQQLNEGLSELRRTVALLRTPVATDLSLPKVLKKLADDFEEATGLHIQVSVPDSLPQLSDGYRLAIYRVAQETLTNIQRHAEANNVSLTLQLSPEAIKLELTDDGIGISSGAAEDGFGLRGIHERATQLGGEVKITTGSDQGTRLVFQLPRTNGESDGQ